MDFSRRTLIGGAVIAAASTMLAEPARPARAQLTWQKADWNPAEFDKLTRTQRRIKQIVHADAINDGRFLNNAKNSLNALHLGFALPADQIQIVCVLNGPANVVNYNDYIWEKYHVGEWAKVTDPKTGKSALRNIFYPSDVGPSLHYSSDDPNSEHSIYADSSVQALQSRGIQFVSCHNSTEMQARAFVHQNHLSVEPEEVAKDMLAHTVPGVIVVPAAAAALAVLQCEGHYSYMAA